MSMQAAPKTLNSTRSEASEAPHSLCWVSHSNFHPSWSCLILSPSQRKSPGVWAVLQWRCDSKQHWTATGLSWHKTSICLLLLEFCWFMVYVFCICLFDVVRAPNPQPPLQRKCLVFKPSVISIEKKGEKAPPPNGGMKRDLRKGTDGFREWEKESPSVQMSLGSALRFHSHNERGSWWSSSSSWSFTFSLF